MIPGCCEMMFNCLKPEDDSPLVIQENPYTTDLNKQVHLPPLQHPACFPNLGLRKRSSALRFLKQNNRPPLSSTRLVFSCSVHFCILTGL